MASDTYYNENFQCRNKDCKKIFKQYVWTSQLEQGETPSCPQCGSKDIEIYFDPNVNSNVPAIGKFTMMSREEKTQSLKKRSHDHYKKNIEEKKRHMWKTNAGIGGAKYEN